MRGKEFDVTVNQKVTAHHAWFYLLGVPVFYTPIFYKALEKQPRRSGILLPSVGNSTLRGPLVNYGYLGDQPQLRRALQRAILSGTGTAEHVFMRGDINATSKFQIQFDTADVTQKVTPSRSGFEIRRDGKTFWVTDGRRGDLNYLSSFNFVQILRGIL